MNLDLYVENINRQLAIAAEAGGDEARALAERLVAPLEAAIRLTLQDALASAAEEITTELAPGSVELRLRGRDPEFVVTPPPADPSADDLAEDPDDRPPALPEGDEGAMSRINLRMPDHLKARIEQAAASEGLSVNAWLVRAAAAALERTGPPEDANGAPPRAPSATRAGHASQPTEGNCRCLPSILPNRSPSPSSSASATSGSWPATAPTPWSRCARATPPRRPT